MSDIHHSARSGFSAGAETYVRGRPDYPKEIAGWLASAIGLREGKRALDLGAGTGKFLPLLLATGAEVIAVEPVTAMRDQLAAALPGVRALAGSAEAIPLADASLDAIVCAQAFHWFANRRAFAEIGRVLKPGGAVGLVWNVRDERVAWVEALTALIQPYEGTAPRYASGEWRRLFPAQGFTPLNERRFAHSHFGPPEQVIVDRILSTSFIAALPASARDDLARRVRALIAATPEIARKETVAFPYETAAFDCRKVG
jgi:SAM-dependent methyltransferase